MLRVLGALRHDRPRLRGAIALLSLSLARGDRVRAPAGWIVNAAATRAAELAAAVHAIERRAELLP
mgnify:CR=1 FL=1